MCGIVGYVSDNNKAANILFEGLKRLEYRGYDSAGIAILKNSRFTTVKSVGNLNSLAEKLSSSDNDGSIGISHTRWATHGKPSKNNAHPHSDCTGNIVIVHNGIIENFQELRDKLIKDGHEFTSETDSEVIAHLIENHYKNGNLKEAVRKAVKHLEGAFAVAVLAKNNPDVLIGIRKDSPLIVGLGKGENFLASAIPAVIPHTKNIIFLEDDDLVELTSEGIAISCSKTGDKLKRKTVKVDVDPSAAEKGGYEDFMLKEIFEQPKAIENTLRARFDENGKVKIDELRMSKDKIKAIDKIIFVACGTSYHAAMVGKYIIENWVGIDTSVEVASEFRYSTPVIKKNTLVIAISQSGETADTLAGIRIARSKGAKVASIVNVVGSLITRESDAVLYTHAGIEIGVAATKTFLAQLIAIYLLALYLGQERGTLKSSQSEEIIKGLYKLPKKVKTILSTNEEIKKVAKTYAKYNDFLYLGRNVGFPVAMEGALKLKEISYIHADGYPAGEMKHGPIALIDKKTPVMVVANESSIKTKIVSNIQESLARSAILLAVATKGDKEIGKMAKEVFWIPKVSEDLSPVLSVVPLQIFAYWMAKERGCNVDQPRNLAKSVTVE